MPKHSLEILKQYGFHIDTADGESKTSFDSDYCHDSECL